MEYYLRLRLLGRIRRILAHPQVATYKLPKKNIIHKLNQYFWNDAKGLDGFWNKIIYKRAVSQISEGISNHGHTIESARNNLGAIIDNRSEEIVDHLINEGYLIADNDNPSNYYIKSIRTIKFLVLFRWVIVNILVLGLIVAIVANIAGSYIWDEIINYEEDSQT